VVDLYLSSPDLAADEDADAAALLDILAAMPFLRIGRRVTVTSCDEAGDVQQFTFRPFEGGLAEERVIRGMHPLTGQRLDLWR